MKTSELTDNALDWAVEVALVVGRVSSREQAVSIASSRNKVFNVGYSTNWASGGPIIDRERIQWCELNGQIEAWSGFNYIQWRTDWDSECRMPDGSGFGTDRRSILIAAMRCFVASKLGEEVDVPKRI
jgi:hypothetical protein